LVGVSVLWTSAGPQFSATFVGASKRSRWVAE
jgi:hypothetical protein